MRISLDTSDPEEIDKANKMLKAAGWQLDKVTTNPTTMAIAMKNYGGTPHDIFCRIRDIGIREISVEALGTRNYDPSRLHEDIFVEEGEAVFSWDPAVAKIKVPAVPEGIKAMRRLSEKEILVNATLVFQKEQAYWAAAAGARYVSPFVGRLDDIGEDGMQLVRDIVEMYKEVPFSTEVLTASTRHTEHIRQAFDAGSDLVTMPWKVFEQCDVRKLAEYGRSPGEKKPCRQEGIHPYPFGWMKNEHFNHPLIEKGVKRFLDDAKSAGYSVL